MALPGTDRLSVLCVALAIPLSAALAQDSTMAPAGRAVVVRNVNLRPTPSTAMPRIRLLHPPDDLGLREDTTTKGFYPVVTDEDEVGWVWARNIHRILDTTEATTPALRTTAAPASSIDASWQKPAPNSTSITIGGQRCGATGKGGDTETNRRKNRTDTAVTYHDVRWEAVAQLPFPVAPPHRHDWTPAQLNEIAPLEGVAIRVTGYLVALKPQGGSGESTNCFNTTAEGTDWHLALVGSFGQGEQVSVVVETTPRVRRLHPGWTVGRLRPWVDADSAVRISGWLMLDPEHRNHLNKYRGTLWEIHPITRIEVQRDSTWVPLDKLP